MGIQEMLLTLSVQNRLFVLLLSVFVLSLSSFVVTERKMEQNISTDTLGFKYSPWHYTLGNEISFTFFVISGLSLVVFTGVIFMSYTFPEYLY